MRSIWRSTWRSTGAMAMTLAVMAVAGCGIAPQPSRDKGLDVEKMNIINATARERGIDVIWIHPPKKKPDAAAKPANLANN